MVLDILEFVDRLDGVRLLTHPKNDPSQHEISTVTLGARPGVLP